MFPKRVIITSAVAVAAFFSGGWLMQQGGQRSTSVYQQARLFDDVLSHISDYYVDSLDQRRLYRMAIDGMLRELRDPYTGFLDGRELRALSEQTTGNYGGVGLQIEVRDGAIVVVAPLADSPAERAGMITGDRIVMVDDSSTQAWSQERAVRSLRGEPGSRVRIRVERPGLADALNYTLTRAQIHSRSVRLAAVLEGGVGYVELSQFSQSTVVELRNAVDSLRGAGMRSLVLDLRFNPGGLLDEGTGVAELFLDPGQLIVATRGRAPGATRRITDRERQPWPDLPLVVLINGASASASEIVAGALQDHDRAVIVGTTSFGKGLVQSVFRLSSEASLKMTTSKWYTPSGRSIQREHQASDDSRDPDDEIAARDSVPLYRTGRGREVRGGGGIAPDIVVRQDSAEAAVRNRLQQALGSNVVKYTDALAAFALEARARGTVSSPTFRVTQEIRARFLELLAERGVRLERDVLEASWSFIDRQLAAQTARFVFGRVGEVRRQAVDDPVLATAARLAARARTPDELFSLAAAPAAPAPQRR
jgi:carboxyl-terminal processing protease